MRKAVLSPNPLPQNKQRFIVDGMSESTHVVTRDSIEIAIETADRPDGTKVPIGRTNPGEFKVSIDLADDNVRGQFEAWADACIDKASAQQNTDTAGGSVVGIDPNYKKNATLVYHRLYQNTQGGKDTQPVKYRLIGCFITSRTLPDYQMDGKDMSMMEFNVSYDDAMRIEDVAAFGYNSSGQRNYTY